MHGMVCMKMQLRCAQATLGAFIGRIFQLRTRSLLFLPLQTPPRLLRVTLLSLNSSMVRQSIDFIGTRHFTAHHVISTHLTSRHLNSFNITSPQLIQHHVTSTHSTSRQLNSFNITSPQLIQHHVTSTHSTSRHSLLSA
jgi:hypothetical protein